jgi:5-methylcytosine-specific restriction enzyme subunit McrC
MQALQHPTTADKSPPPITLAEYGSTEAALSPDVFALLQSRYVKQLDITHTGQEGVYRITARDYVGRVSLPGGGLLVIRPKVGVANLFYMLCADAGIADFHPPPTGLQRDPDIFPFVLQALLYSIEKLLARGLYRDYERREERLPYVRGRILLQEQACRGWLDHVHTCAFAELSTDTPENRVLAATLRLIPTLLAGHNEQATARRSRALLRRFAGVTPVRRAEALFLLPRLNIHRLNAAYGPALALCKLALRGLTLNEQEGAHPYASFMVDMPRLFESFLTQKLSRLLPLQGLRVVAQKHDFLDEERRVGIRPDVLVYPRHGGAPLLVLDAKYRRPGGPEGDSGLNSDLYQVSAYLDRYRLKEGVLVYPHFSGDENTRLNLRGTPKHLHLLTLDLSVPTPALLDEACVRLAQSLQAILNP